MAGRAAWPSSRSGTARSRRAPARSSPAPRRRAPARCRRRRASRCMEMVPPVKEVIMETDRRRVRHRSASRPLPRSPAQHAPAVHVHHLAGDVPRQVAAEEQDRPRDVLRRRDPAERDRRPRPASRPSPAKAGMHMSVSTQPGATQLTRMSRRVLDRERLGERDDGALRRRVVAVVRLPALARRARHDARPARPGPSGRAPPSW